jgi:predicted transcriptional regulator
MSRAERLDAAMSRAGVNLKSLSSLCRVCRTSIYEFCQGSDVRLSVIERMATALNVSPAWLAWGLEVEKIADDALVVRGDVLDPMTIAWVDDVRREVPGAVVVFEQAQHTFPP